MKYLLILLLLISSSSIFSQNWLVIEQHTANRYKDGKMKVVIDDGKSINTIELEDPSFANLIKTLQGEDFELKFVDSSFIIEGKKQLPITRYYFLRKELIKSD
ncbi:MAG: hypothetical protein CMC79_00450 [Flavobacteriaceae bacterium]|nr:hypothetical protein [Flavobacteriaceae bacterium]|tara:strand:+ start:5625 stop:5933 length:309 start_codon:yes stop_codon:yes gene_type:complete